MMALPGTSSVCKTQAFTFNTQPEGAWQEANCHLSEFIELGPSYKMQACLVFKIKINAGPYEGQRGGDGRWTLFTSETSAQGKNVGVEFNGGLVTRGSFTQPNIMVINYILQIVWSICMFCCVYSIAVMVLIDK